jgi:hypothetical protein
MSPYRVVAAEVRAEGVAFELRLNGATCYRDRGGEAADHVAKLNPWVVDGENVFAVTVALPPGASPDGGGRLMVRVLEAEHGYEPGPEALLLEWIWDPRAAPAEVAPVVVVERPLRFAQSHGRWQWQDAAAYGDAERPLVEALVGEVHAAVARRDLDRLADLYAVSDAELDRALDLPPGFQLVARTTGWLETLSQDDLAVEPLDPAALVLVPRAGGRLVDVLGPDGGPPVRATGGGRRLDLDLTVSRVGDGYGVVR